MSRFTPTRRNRIVAWTGAALAWGTALTTATLEPARAASQATQTTDNTTSEAATQAAMPTQPLGGIVILRYKPAPVVDPPVKTVYTKKPAPVVTVPTPTPTPKPAPAPRSRGS